MTLIRPWRLTAPTAYGATRLESDASVSPDGNRAVAIRSNRGWEVYQVDSTGLELFAGYTSPAGTALLENTAAALRDYAGLEAA